MFVTHPPSPPDAGRSIIRKEVISPLLAAFCRCALLYSLGHDWMHPFWVNGPWQLRGHMQPSPLLLDHVQDGLPENGSQGHTAGLLNSVVNTSCLSSLPFCSSNIIHHFFCDSPHFLSSHVLTACHEASLYIRWCEYGWGSASDPHLLLLHSLLHLPHACQGRGRKAFSTCASHLTAIMLHPIPSIHTYLRPSSSYSLTQGQSGSVVLQWSSRVEPSDLQPQE